jgi:GH24 family phage-related lysozyme (muramidase)
MPKATINENGNPLLPKDKIRMTKYLLIPTPTLQSVPPKRIRENELCRLVSFAFNSGHNLRSSGLGEYVRHGELRPALSSVSVARRDLRTAIKVKRHRDKGTRQSERTAIDNQK